MIGGQCPVNREGGAGTMHPLPCTVRAPFSGNAMIRVRAGSAGSYDREPDAHGFGAERHSDVTLRERQAIPFCKLSR